MLQRSIQLWYLVIFYTEENSTNKKKNLEWVGRKFNLLLVMNVLAENSYILLL